MPVLVVAVIPSRSLRLHTYGDRNRDRLRRPDDVAQGFDDLT